MFGGYTRDKRTDRERYLEDEVERHQESEERRRRWEDEEREKRMQARHEQYEYDARQASDWPEALNKQISLCRREVNDGGDEEIGNFFANTVLACEKALDIWQFVEAGKRQQIAELESKIFEIQESIRREVADKLEESDSRSEFSQVANQIRKDQLSCFLDW